MSRRSAARTEAPYLSSEPGLRTHCDLTAPRACVCVVCVCGGRYTCLPPMPFTWVVLPIQLLHGITFGLYWTIGVGYAAASAPRGLEATLQGAFSALISAAQMVALTAGGPVLHAYGGARLYGGCATVATVVALVPMALLASRQCSYGRAATKATGVRAAAGSRGDAAAAGVVLNGFDEGDDGDGDGGELVARGALTSSGERKHGGAIA